MSKVRMTETVKDQVRGKPISYEYHFYCECGNKVEETHKFCTQCGEKLEWENEEEKDGENMKLPKEIVTKLVGLQYNAGPAPAGATVELVREYDFPNHIVAYNDSDLKVGSIIHTRYDADIVDGIPNNDELIDIFHRYNWVVIRSNGKTAWIKGTIDVPELLPMEEEVDYKEVMKNLINLYNKHAAMHDTEGCKGLAILIRQTEEKI